MNIFPRMACSHYSRVLYSSDLNIMSGMRLHAAERGHYTLSKLAPSRGSSSVQGSECCACTNLIGRKLFFPVDSPHSSNNDKVGVPPQLLSPVD